MPPILVGVDAPISSVVTPSTNFRLPQPNATWSTANAAASLASASRADQLSPPAFSTSTGEHVYDVERTMCLVRPVLRGVATHVMTFNVWLWWQGPYQLGNASLTSIEPWTPWLLGRFTATFAGAGTSTVGVAGGAVVASGDLYCSNLAVVATYDRRGDYSGLWKILQPAVDDGSPAMLMFDTLGAAKVSLEGRTTTAAESFHFSVAGLTAI